MFRRALRIFPAYFLLLIVLYQSSFFLYNTLSEDWIWYATYFQNFLFYTRQAWPSGKLSHFWTLAVEEQFYLIWPLLLLFTQSKRVGMIIGLLFLTGIVTFHIFPHILLKKQMVDMLTPTCFHAFAAGAAVAWAHIYHTSWFNKTSQLLTIGLFCLCLSFLSRLYDFNIVIDQRSLVALGTSCLIVFILKNSQDRFCRHILGNPVMVSIGKVSYGIYLYHNFIPVFTKGILRWIHKMNPLFVSSSFITDLSRGGVLFNIGYLLILLVLAFSSYRFIEQPLLALKNKVS
jgi:peptidoglycan/LPS O-acetylase OafA/YrhL